MTRRFAVYVLALGGAVLIVAGLLELGSAWFPTRGQAAAVTTGTPVPVVADVVDAAQRPLPRLLVQLLVIVLAARALGALARRAGQPAVIGEIASGLLLGPSVLGWLSPAVSGLLFPESSLPTLQLLSQIGVVLFMFVVGVELEPSRLRGHAGVAMAVSNAGIVIPFILGVMLALALYGAYAPAGVPFHSFALFCGIATSITAFPVLVRILEDHRLIHTPLGTTAIACAAVNDVTAWSILAFVVAVTTSGGALQTLAVMTGLSAVFLMAMLFVVRPLLSRLLHPGTMGDTLSKERTAVVLAVLLAAALVTEVIGIHALFGAFVAGTVMPIGDRFRTILRDRFESLSSVLLLPIFFAYTGLRTHLGLLDDLGSWATCLAIIVVATTGKLGGTVAAARWTGLPWRDAVALGALMNTRGLMELIALNVGYDLGILSPAIFTMLVVMALVTTAMTGPLLTLSLTWARRGTIAAAGSVPRSP